MKLTPTFESAWRADEIVRLGRALKYRVFREKYRKILLDEMDRDLPDYPRPTKVILAKKKKFIKAWFKMLIP